MNKDGRKHASIVFLDVFEDEITHECDILIIHGNENQVEKLAHQGAPNHWLWIEGSWLCKPLRVIRHQVDLKAGQHENHFTRMHFCLR